MNTVTIPFLVDGTEKLAEIRLERIHVGVDNHDTWTWEWGIIDGRGYTVVDSGVTQHLEHLGLFNLFHKILGYVLCKKESR